MVVVSGWLIDAVISRLLDDAECDEVRRAAENEPENLIRDNVPIGSINGRGVFIGVDRRDGARRIIGSATLGDGVRYKSAHDRSYQMMGVNGPEGLKRVEFEPSLSVKGAVPPRSVIDALVGRHARAVFNHDALRVDGLVATASYVNTRDGVPTGFSIGLPQIHVGL